MKKGYTLVELLAVIVILAIILSIVSLNVLKIFNDRRQRDFDNIKMIIEENAKVLVNTDTKISVGINDKLQDLENAGQTATCKLSYSKLVEAGLMDEDTENPINSKVINEKSYIQVTLNSDYDYDYNFVYVDSGSDISASENCVTD